MPLGKFTIKCTNLSEDFTEFFFKHTFLYEKNIIFDIKKKMECASNNNEGLTGIHFEKM
jgi:hypothetical protein